MKRRRIHDLTTGDRVQLLDSSMTGKIVRKGEQQSEVLLDAGYSQYFPNHWLGHEVPAEPNNVSEPRRIRRPRQR